MFLTDFICETYSFVKEVSTRKALVAVYLLASSFSSFLGLQAVWYNRIDKLANMTILFMILNGY
jgi:hypothetical protein